MDGMVSWVVLVGAFAAVAGASSILTVKLFRVSAHSAGQSRPTARSRPAEKPPVAEPSRSQSPLR